MQKKRTNDDAALSLVEERALKQTEEWGEYRPIK